MKRGGPLRRKSRIQPGKRLQRSRILNPMPPGMREQVWRRDRGICVLCAGSLNPNRWECHHRLLLSRGGKHDLSNLIALHPRCHHELVHGQPETATAAGWMVPSEQDPALWPVVYQRSGRVLLDHVGQVNPDPYMRERTP